MTDDRPEPTRRVLVLVDQYVDPYGGTEGQIHALLTGLPDSWRAEMWVLQPGTWWKRHPFPCRVRNLGLHRLAHPGTLLRLEALARSLRGRFDLIQTYMNDASIVGPLLGARAGLPVVLARRDLGFWQTPRLLEALRRTDRLAWGVITNCEAVKAHTVEAEHVPPGCIEVVGNGHDPARFEGRPEPGLRARLGIPEDAPIVGLLANIKPLKRHDDLLDAVERLTGKHPGLHALCLGEPVAAGESLEARARRRGIGDRVHVLLAPGNAVPLLKHLDVGVLCSNTEGLSNAVIEYLGTGLPVVATSVGGNPELVTPGENGFLYAPGDVDTLTAHLDALLSDGALRARMGEASRQHFEGRFTRDRMVEATTTIWEEAISPAPPRPGTGEIAWSVVDDTPQLESLADAWDALLGPHQLFLGPDWYLAWLAHGGDGDTPHAIVGRNRSGELVGLLPLVRRDGVLGFAGQGEGADHLDVVAAPGTAETIARGALGMAFHDDPGQRLRLLHLAEDGALRQVLRRAGLALRWGERRSTSCPFAAVEEQTWDEYVASRFSYAARRNIRRYPRRFRKLEGARVERVASPEDAAAGIDRFLALHHARFDAREETSALDAEPIRAFHRDLATRMARRGRLALTFLGLGDRDVACEYAFRHGNKLYAFQSGFLEDAGFESPGVVLQAIVMEEDVFAAGLAEYDFLDGTEDYKRRWATGRRRLYDVEVYGLTHRAATRGLALGAAHLAHDLWKARAPETTPSH